MPWAWAAQRSTDRLAASRACESDSRPIPRKIKPSQQWDQRTAFRAVTVMHINREQMICVGALGLLLLTCFFALTFSLQARS
jgi:hypothetical protein